MILLIIVALPRTRPSVQQAGTLHKLQHAVDAGTANPKAAKGSSTATYNIIIDAGSTGSRVHTFKFEGSGKDLSLVSDTFHQLKPGLSAYPDDPVKAAESLKPLLEEALKTVPKAAQVGTQPHCCICAFLWYRVRLLHALSAYSAVCKHQPLG